MLGMVLDKAHVVVVAHIAIRSSVESRTPLGGERLKSLYVRLVSLCTATCDVRAGLTRLANMLAIWEGCRGWRCFSQNSNKRFDFTSDSWFRRPTGKENPGKFRLA